MWSLRIYYMCCCIQSNPLILALGRFWIFQVKIWPLQWPGISSGKFFKKKRVAPKILKVALYREREDDPQDIINAMLELLWSLLDLSSDFGLNITVNFNLNTLLLLFGREWCRRGSGVISLPSPPSDTTWHFQWKSFSDNKFSSIIQGAEVYIRPLPLLTVGNIHVLVLVSYKPLFWPKNILFTLPTFLLS